MGLLQGVALFLRKDGCLFSSWSPSQQSRHARGRIKKHMSRLDEAVVNKLPSLPAKAELLILFHTNPKWLTRSKGCAKNRMDCNRDRFGCRRSPGLGDARTKKDREPRNHPSQQGERRGDTSLSCEVVQESKVLAPIFRAAWRPAWGSVGLTLAERRQTRSYFIKVREAVQRTSPQLINRASFRLEPAKGDGNGGDGRT